MLDLRRRWECVWDCGLRPVGHNGDDGIAAKEPFAAWWARHAEALAHLHPQIAEQWIYRHWSDSYMAFLPLPALTWRREHWDADRILRDVRLEFGGPMDAGYDYHAMNSSDGFGPISTARALNTGTWDMPLLALSTPNGVRSLDGDLPEVRFVVAEGAKRMRYLNALRARSEAPGPHEVLILESPDAG